MKIQEIMHINGKSFEVYEYGTDSDSICMKEFFLKRLKFSDMPDSVFIELEDIQDSSYQKFERVVIKKCENVFSINLESTLRSKYWDKVVSMPQYMKLFSKLIKSKKAIDVELNVNYEYDNPDDYNNFTVTINYNISDDQTVAQDVLYKIEMKILEPAIRELEQTLKEIECYIEDKINSI